MPEPVTCPDCGQPLETHQLFRDGNCPVVPLPDAPVGPSEFWAAGFPLRADPMVPVGTVELHDERGIVRRVRIGP